MSLSQNMSQELESDYITPSPHGMVIVITENNVRLRATASLNGTILGHVHRNDEAELFGHATVNGFASVRMRSGQNRGVSGWIYGTFFRFI